MSKKIQTYNDLLEEKERLETLLGVQKQQMKTSWDHLLLEAAPVTNVFSHVKQFFRADRSNPAVNFAVNMAGDTFLKHIVLRKADWVTRLIVPTFAKNYASNFFNKEKTQRVMHKVKALFQKTPKRHSAPAQRTNIEGGYNPGNTAYQTTSDRIGAQPTAVPVVPPTSRTPVTQGSPQ